MVTTIPSSSSFLSKKKTRQAPFPIIARNARNRGILKTLTRLKNPAESLLWVLNKSSSARRGDILLVEEAPYPLFSCMFSIPPCNTSYPIKYHMSCLHKRKTRLVNAEWIDHPNGIRIVFATRNIKAGERWFVSFTPFLRGGPMKSEACEETEREHRLEYIHALTKRTYIPRARYI